MKGMNRDIQDLYYLIGKQLKVIQANIDFIRSTVEDEEELAGEAYLMRKDTFELLILMRALRDMIEDIL